MVFVGVMVGDSVGGVADGANERDEKGSKGCMGVVAETKATAFEWEVSKEERELRERCIGVQDVLEEQVVGWWTEENP